MSGSPKTSSQEDDWRKNIQQSYRSEEVKNIAKVLASLEPNATTASKLMLASKFENQMFATASDFNDYRKKITKRLKKIQKSYNATTATSDEVLLEQQKDEVMQLQRRLKSLYGEKLEFIAKYGRFTVKEFRDKFGEEKSKNLMDHIDQAITWAAEIGAVPESKAILASTGLCVRIPRRSPPETLSYLGKVEMELEKRVDNIRGYCVKLTKPELFFSERLDEMEQKVLLNFDSSACQMYVESMRQALTNSKDDVNFALDTDTATAAATSETDVDLSELKGMLEKMRSVIPHPRSKEEEKESMLAHLNRIRIASQYLIKYATFSPQQQTTKLQLAGSLRKVHDLVHHSILFLKESFREERGEQGDSSIILEDIWNKILDYDGALNKSSVTATEDGKDSALTAGPSTSDNAKSFNTKRLVIRSRVLFTKRYPPKNLLDAMNRKYNVNVCGEGKTTYLKVIYGDVFEMSLFFSPILVRIRALPGSEEKNAYKKSTFRKDVIDCSSDSWVAPTAGMKRTSPLSSLNSQQQPIGRKRNANGDVKTEQVVSIMGVSANIDSVMPIVAKKLDYASAHATRCLRRCFAEHTLTSKSDFEIEISEGNAVLKFLQLARKTYQIDLDEYANIS
mmetsp:Transcript_12620/g.23662  ORF Transcript_12620/g.23662 Transcript_12620/m.23662 type:complete len:622 (+) Transcript_12620:161-2026(+)|eukprot:CAMPEP_0176488090 /NCGR_PEP_ID=MMETSP0200_2-20121128/6519_1 /TAXON_ID=947934 /ORGANISM="Chaetoceros sp., Strain GSL56" /LENGTH=621 /DNA_ID=CAMNT_0017885041 /DNA_START=89 /DNA_END=1954 /DNA_ORIENTATION=+